MDTFDFESVKKEFDNRKIAKAAEAQHTVERDKRNADIQRNADREAANDYKSMYDKLKKFVMLSTGVLSTDRIIRAMYGDWLTPQQEQRAILFEMHRNRQNPARLAELQNMLEASETRVSGEPQPFYQINRLRIPFEIPNEPGKIGYSILRQVLIWSPPVQDSGQYRITFVKRTNRYSVICMVKGKKITDFETETEFTKYLGYIFPPEVVSQIFFEFWE